MHLSLGNCAAFSHKLPQGLFNSLYLLNYISRRGLSTVAAGHRQLQMSALAQLIDKANRKTDAFSDALKAHEEHKDR